MKLFKMVYFALFSFILISPVYGLSDDFAEGKNYLVIPQKVVVQKKEKIKVLEFFSYGCPWCYKLDPALRQWAKSKKDISFERVPVIFEENWDIFARAYYIMIAFNKENEVGPSLFDAVQKEIAPIQTVESLKQFLEKKGISANEFESAYHSPTIDADINQAKALMEQYQINTVPTVIIADQFQTNLSMVQGDPQKMIRLLNFLLAKSKK